MAPNLENVSGYFRNILSSGTRTVAALAIIGIVVSGIVVMFLWGGGNEYSTLYTQLSAEDSGSVIEKLKQQRVRYKVDGTTISVPADKVYELRMELAAQGLPQGGGVGYEIFDKTGFGVTEFVQKVNYKRALQGELARTISQIKEIESARVHLALPDKGVFLDEQKKARASIVVKLKQGKQLTQGQVAAIVHLVANAYENMRPEDVTVVDTAGRMWSNGSQEDNAYSLTASQSDYKKSVEKDLENRVQTMLEKAVGMNKAVARVSVELDTRHIEKTEEIYDPDSKVVRSEHRNKERITGGTAALGVPGVLSNIPEGQAPMSGGPAPSESQRQDDTVNYEINKVVSHTIEPVSTVKRLTVAVLVDGNYETVKGEDGKDVKKYTARSEEDITKYTEMVKAAVGYSDKRGDVITVVNTPFGSDFQEGPAEEKPGFANVYVMPVLPSLLKYGSLVLVALFAILFILRPVARKLVGDTAGSTPALAGAGSPGALPEGSMSEHALMAGEREQKNENSDNLKRIVQDNPQQAAMIIKGWIKER